MNISLIASAVYKNFKFGIGSNGKLLYKIHEDIQWFKNKTMGGTVVMGYKTWESIGKKPLQGRRNIVLTRNHLSETCKEVVFTTFENVVKVLTTNEKIFVIGGSDIYTLFLKDVFLRPNELFITLVEPENISKNIDCFFEPSLIENYKLVSCSQKFDKKEENLKFRYLKYEFSSTPHQEKQYLDTMKQILETGNERLDRTGVGTYSIFGKQLRFDISKSIPMMTSKKVSFKNIVEELLWFCRGETDSNILKQKGVHIWDGNSSREFLNSRGLFHLKQGECGPIYGHQWRNFGDKIDQLKYVEDLIKNDPTSRRIILSAWNPMDLNKMCLVPCHLLVQWYVESGKLNCMFTMRSSDFALASTYNIVSYSILTYILALKCGYTPGEIVYSAGDCHIYKNHFLAVEEQLKRQFTPFPMLLVNSTVKNKSWEEIKYEDFEIVGYFPKKAIKMDMAI